MPNPLEISTVYVPDRARWRAWLQAHHDSEPQGIWLVYYKPHANKPTLEYNESVEEALCFGWVDSLIRRIDEDRYARKFTPRKPDSNWSPSNRKRVASLIEQGLMEAPGLALVEAAKAAGTWGDEPRPEVSDTPSTTFREALAANERAQAFFDGLTKAQQRHYVQWINSAKRDDTKQRRVEESIALLTQGRKLGMK